MVFRWALNLSLASAAAAALINGRQTTFSVAQRCVDCHPPIQRETYCAAAFPSPDNYSAPSEDADLVAVQLIARHGDRAPLVTKAYWDVTWDCTGDQQFTFFASNATGIQPERAMISREVVSIPGSGPFSSLIWRGSCAVGQLTPRGAAYQRQLGRQLREIYVDKVQFLPDTIEETPAVSVRSTAYGRTKQSASRILSGLYPDKFRPDGSIVDMVTLPKEIEYLLRNSETCPAQGKIMRSILKSKPFRSHMKQNRQLAKKLQAIFGIPHNPSWPKERTFMSYFEYLAPRACHQMPLPCDKSLHVCLTDEDVKTVMRNAQWEMSYIFRDSPFSRQFNRLVTGYFLGELRDKMKHHADSNGSDEGDQLSTKHHHQARFEIYSAHAETLASLLGALHVQKVGIPPYSSNLIIELWKRRPSDFPSRERTLRTTTTGLIRYDNYFVRILYNGKPLDVQWCDMNACPSRVIWENTKQLISSDILEECHAKKIAGEVPGDDDDDDNDDDE